MIARSNATPLPGPLPLGQRADGSPSRRSDSGRCVPQLHSYGATKDTVRRNRRQEEESRTKCAERFRPQYPKIKKTGTSSEAAARVHRHTEVRCLWTGASVSLCARHVEACHKLVIASLCKRLGFAPLRNPHVTSKQEFRPNRPRPEGGARRPQALRRQERMRARARNGKRRFYVRIKFLRLLARGDPACTQGQAESGRLHRRDVRDARLQPRASSRETAHHAPFGG